MARKINIQLSTTSIKSTITQFKQLQKELKKLGNDISETLADKTVEQMESFYNNLGSTQFKKEKSKNKCYVIAYGDDVAYEEFGTGDIGESSYHPSKDKFGGKLHLLRYNLDHLMSEGKGWIIIDTDKGGYKWYHDGEWHKGIPAGNFVFEADLWLHDNYKVIVKEKVSDVLSEVFSNN